MNVVTSDFADEISKRINGSACTDPASKGNVLTYKKEVQVAKRVPREERETIIRLDETDGPAIIYTFNADLKRRLRSFTKKHPELCSKSAEDKEYGSETYELEKSRLSIRLTEPYSEARLKSVGDLGRKNGTRRNKD